MKIQLTKEEAERLLKEAIMNEYREAFTKGTGIAYKDEFNIHWNGQFIGDDNGLLTFEAEPPAQS